MRKNRISNFRISLSATNQAVNLFAPGWSAIEPITSNFLSHLLRQTWTTRIMQSAEMGPRMEGKFGWSKWQNELVVHAHTMRSFFLPTSMGKVGLRREKEKKKGERLKKMRKEAKKERVRKSAGIRNGRWAAKGREKREGGRWVVTKRQSRQFAHYPILTRQA